MSPACPLSTNRRTTSARDGTPAATDTANPATTTRRLASQTLRNSLELVQSQDSRDRDDKVLLHRPRLAEPAADDVENVATFPEIRQEAQAV